MTDEPLQWRFRVEASRTVGQAAREIRLPRKQDEIGADGLISQPLLSRVENGRQALTLEMVMRLAVALGCRPSDLLSGLDEAYDNVMASAQVTAGGAA